MKIPKLKPMQLVEVEWVDSMHSAGWMNTAEVDLEKENQYLDHWTVGYFLGETKRGMTFVQSKSREYPSGNRSIDSQMTIPIVAITKIRKLA